VARKPTATYARFCYLVRPVLVDRSDTAGKSHTLVRVYADGEAEARTAAAGKAMHTTLASAATFVDPEQTEEPRALLQQRLALLCKTLAVLSLGFFVFERAVSALFFGNTAVQHLFLTRPAVFHAAATLLFGLVWLACRSRRLPLAALSALDAAMPVLAAAAFSAMAYHPANGVAALVPVLCIMAAMLCRATLVPSSPRRTLLITSFAVLPAVVGASLSGGSLLGSPSLPPGIYVGLWGAVIVGLATLTSRTIYGLEQKVREARQLGQYTLVERIGAGGMGVVYRAEHAMLRRPTAIKVLPPERMGEQSLNRFEREVQLTSRLTHPNTVAIYDYGRTPDGLFYYAMEYLEGLTLTQLVELCGPLPAERAAFIMRQVAGSLAEAHGFGLIHRDIKPDNILICDRGGTCDFAKVLDFGLVKDIKSGDASLSNVNLMVGTPAYMSPEAITSPATVAFPRDLYAIGAVTYFLVTGREVFLGRTTMEVCTHHVRTPPEAPSRVLGSALPEALEQLILTCLAKDPSARPQSAALIEQALAEVVGAAWGQAQARAWWDQNRAGVVRVRRSRPVPGSDRTLGSGDELLARQL
jgi:eukaryotic-like serine/threonine-protein kinase